MLKHLWGKWGPNPFDLRLKRAMKKKAKKVLITWNRGMGDVALGMYALVYRIQQFLPDAEVTFLVRADLKEAFSFLKGVRVFAAGGWKRGVPFDLDETLSEIGLERSCFDLVLENSNPTQWLKWQLGTLVPRLYWNPELDHLTKNFDLQGGPFIAMHVQTETGSSYGYEKNWPLEKWQELCRRLIREKGATILLFGLKSTEDFAIERVVDLRGKTHLSEMLALIKNCSSHLVVPDSGVLSLTYYLDTPFPLQIVSLWSDPRQGVLKQNVDSPNALLKHTPLIGKEEKVGNISVDEVIDALAVDLFDPLLKKQRETLFAEKRPLSNCEPTAQYQVPPERSSGASLLQEGKVGCLILAGGQGSRLGSSLPKGLVPVTPIKGKTLFQIFCEKAVAASSQSGFALPLAIMTSPLNHQATVEYIEREKRFGLSEEQVSYFTQEMLPFLDDKGHWLLEAGGKIARGPDGNGRALYHFFCSGIWEKWKKAGIEYVNVVLIDNPLADPFDPALCAAHVEAKADITLKCVPRLHVEEKVGVVGLSNGRLKVIEYLDLPEEEKAASRSDGFLLWNIANAGLFCFSMDFIEKVVAVDLPWHLTRKGGLWKFETFIFDLLDYAKKTHLLLYPREEAHAPLKNAAGEASLETVRRALLARDRKIFETISGLIAPERPFELDFAFHYPTSQLLDAWRGKSLPECDYVAADFTNMLV
jgi:UDP-N-acetylglucosamine/UDP-N-acetylgalactosamine diphosphorylase